MCDQNYSLWRKLWSVSAPVTYPSRIRIKKTLLSSLFVLEWSVPSATLDVIHHFEFETRVSVYIFLRGLPVERAFSKNFQFRRKLENFQPRAKLWEFCFKILKILNREQELEKFSWNFPLYWWYFPFSISSRKCVVRLDFLFLFGLDSLISKILKFLKTPFFFFPWHYYGWICSKLPRTINGG